MIRIKNVSIKNDKIKKKIENQNRNSLKKIK